MPGSFLMLLYTIQAAMFPLADTIGPEQIVVTTEDDISKAIARMINNEICIEDNNITECIGGRMDNETISGYVLEDVFDLCPYSEICHRRPKLLEKKTGVCCGNCSCSEDCGKTNSCCFKSMDQYHLVQRNHLTCIKPYISQLEEYSSQAYFMVDNCFEKDRGYTTDCRFINGTETLQPVTSNSGKTYYNKRCAACNEDQDTIKWRKSLVCPRRSLASLNLGIELALRANYCVMQFYPPDVENMTILTCDLMINYCNDPSLADLCHSINLPFTDYANVFCYLCSLKRDVPTAPKRCGDITAVDTQNWITGILDFTVDITPADLIKNRRMSRVCGQQEIYYSYKNTCLPIFCPEGMIQIRDTCNYIGIVMKSKEFLSLQLRLRPVGTSIMESSAFDTLNLTLRLTPLEWMSSACIDQLHPIYFSINVLRDASSNSSDLSIPIVAVAVRMEFLAEGKHLSEIVDAVKNDCLMDNGWTIRIDDTSYDFVADLDFYYVDWKGFPQRDPGQSLQMTSDVITTTTIAISSRISKLNFCQQIQLNEDEIDTSSVSHQILILPSRYEVGSNSFANSRSVARICLDDFQKAMALADGESMDVSQGGAKNAHAIVTVSAYLKFGVLLIYIVII